MRSPLTEAAAVRSLKREKQGAAELRFSGAVRPPIQLEFGAVQSPVRPAARQRPFRVPWSPVPMSEDALAKHLDRVILAAAVLLFLTIALASMRGIPHWPLGVALVAVAVGVFTTVYKLIFASCVGKTPGRLLAQLASKDEGGE